MTQLDARSILKGINAKGFWSTSGGARTDHPRRSSDGTLQSHIESAKVFV
jgi:hypothetical protein